MGTDVKSYNTEQDLQGLIPQKHEKHSELVKMPRSFYLGGGESGQIVRLARAHILLLNCFTQNLSSYAQISISVFRRLKRFQWAKLLQQIPKRHLCIYTD